jgi:DNA-3-methyladenine glycosylase II
MVEVTQEGPAESPRLRVHISGDKAVTGESIKRKLRLLLRKVLGTSEDVREFYRIAGTHRKFNALAQKFIGLKPPCFPSVFEAVMNAFACQQLSLNVGITLLNRLSETYGASLRTETGLIHAFPTPEDLANATPEALRKLGFSNHKGLAIVNLACAIVEKRVNIERLASKNDLEAAEALREINGVGRWTAEYVLLRGLGRLSVFPGDDVGAQNNLQWFLSLKERPDYETIQRIMRRWKPYGGFVYFHFLIWKLWDKGFLQA